jgi:hypothetical protein
MVNLAKEKGVDIEAAAVAGNHNTSVPGAMKRSIEFFQKR